MQKQSLKNNIIEFKRSTLEKNIEELLMGLPVDFDPEHLYYQVNSGEGYVLCTHSKREIKKIEKDGLDEVIMYYTLSPDLSQVTTLRVVSPKDKTEIRVVYTERELIDSFFFPKIVNISYFC